MYWNYNKEKRSQYSGIIFKTFGSSIDKCSLTYKKKKSKALKSYFDDAGVACVEILEKGTMQVAVSSALPGEYVLIKALQPMLGRFVLLRY